MLQSHDCDGDLDQGKDCVDGVESSERVTSLLFVNNISIRICYFSYTLFTCSQVINNIYVIIIIFPKKNV